jgi:hypothetical protein
VVARNLHRRHLTESQRALVAARLKPLFEDEARQRQAATQLRGNDFPVVTNLSPPEMSREKRRSVHRAAELMKVSRGSVQAADKIQKQGVAPLIAATHQPCGATLAAAAPLPPGLLACRRLSQEPRRSSAGPAPCWPASGCRTA